MKRAPFILCLLLLPQAAAADELGRLFFTPEQRALLDLARRTQTRTAEGEGGLTLNGIVVRSDGKQTVWVNGREERSARATAPATALIPLPGVPAQVKLRVGQTLDPLTGRVGERLRPAVPPRVTPAPGPAPTPGDEDAQASRD